MDREIDRKVRRRTWTIRGAWLTTAVLVVGLAATWGPRWLKPSVMRTQLRTAKVEWGPVEAFITASGTVVPEFEGVLSSPIDARVIRVLERPGALLRSGEPILELDTSQSQLALERINQNLALKTNEQSRTRLDLENTLISLKSQTDIKRLELESLCAKVDQNRNLRADGLISSEDLRRSEFEEAKARTELRQLEESRANAEQISAARIEGLALELATLQKEKIAAEEELRLATTKSDRAGVLTWVVAEEGSTVRKGEVIARIADLGTFRVDAKLSDVHANRLVPGMPARIRINDEVSIAGQVRRILPTIQNGVLTVQVELAERANRLLRSNLRVDVLIVSEGRSRALRVRKGPAVAGEGAREVFVVRGGFALRKVVRLGISGFDYCEILDGLGEGEEIVISDMTDFAHMKEVPIR